MSYFHVSKDGLKNNKKIIAFIQLISQYTKK